MSATPRHCLLVVDDEPYVADSVHDLLRREFRVLKAANAAEGMKIVEENDVHVIMTDQRMPAMTGAELLSRARGESPEAIRMIFTGYADLKAVVDAVNRGEIFRYLTKPWDPDELCAILHEACRSYETAAERRRLLSDFRNHVAQGLSEFQGQDGQWLEQGKALVDRADQVLKAKEVK